MRRSLLLISTAVALTGCAGSSSLSPVQLVGDTQANVAVQEFLLYSGYLAYQYELTLGVKADPPLAGQRSRINRDLFGFPIRSEIPYELSLALDKFGSEEITETNKRKARSNYIKSGAYASMILCRNYLSGLRDRNEYFEFLQKELNVAGGITNIAMQLANANGTIRTSVTEGLIAINQGVDAYESFRFLSPEIETILPIVINAQISLRDYYLTEGKAPTTFSGAMNAVSQIEYQCTRSGIRSILNKALVQGAPQFNVINGSLYATYPTVTEKKPQSETQTGKVDDKQKPVAPVVIGGKKDNPPAEVKGRANP